MWGADPGSGVVTMSDETEEAEGLPRRFVLTGTIVVMATDREDAMLRLAHALLDQALNGIDATTEFLSGTDYDIQPVAPKGDA